jgi:hypothetical protein
MIPKAFKPRRNSLIFISPSHSRVSFGCDILPGHHKMYAQSKPFLRTVQEETPAGLSFIKVERRYKK